MEIPYEFNMVEFFLDERIKEGKGDRPAVLFEDTKITYRQIQEGSYKVANFLAKNGVRIEDRVIISQFDSPEYVYSLFGILRLGAVVVMVNPDLKSEEFQYFLDYSRARAAIVNKDLLPMIRSLKNDYLNVLVTPDQMTAASDPISARTTKDDASIWLFSGGTTGKPKAAVQTHGAFANAAMKYAKEVIGYSENDITLSVPKLYFGYATGANLLFPFSVGATSVLFKERSTAEAIFSNIRKYRPTILVNVPTVINRMVQQPDAASQDLSPLRLSISAGEPLPPELYRRWKSIFGVEILDGIGTAEMWHIFISNRLGNCKSGSLGQVVSGYEAKVCDENGTEVAPGEVGMLWIKGESRAIWYFNQLERTKQVFRGEWYVTGDLFKKDEEDYFYYVGRKDDLMKVAGRWVSPQEIEDRLLSHPAVKECAVIAASDITGLVKPYAFVITRHHVTEQELKDWIMVKLDAYKCPKRIEIVQELPRTHLGKVDRAKLRDLVKP